MNTFSYDVWQVYTWGHRLVTPKRVIVARNLKKSGSTPLKFHRKIKLHVVSIAAGMVHSTALTEDGALFYWASSDPDLRCQQVFFDNLVSIWTCAVHMSETLYVCFSNFVAIFNVWKECGQHFCWEVLDCCSYSYR